MTVIFHKIFQTKFAHGFVLFCFVLVMLFVSVRFCNLFTHSLQYCFTGMTRCLILGWDFMWLEPNRYYTLKENRWPGFEPIKCTIYLIMTGDLWDVLGTFDKKYPRHIENVLNWQLEHSVFWFLLCPVFKWSTINPHTLCYKYLYNGLIHVVNSW